MNYLGASLASKAIRRVSNSAAGLGCAAVYMQKIAGACRPDVYPVRNKVSNGAEVARAF